jgi:anthranilate phosphoribosyltransferase
MNEFSQWIGQLRSQQDLSEAQTATAVDLIMSGEVPSEQISEFLVALHEKGETVAEIAGAAAAMRQHMTQVHTQHTLFVDTCGTGGDGSGTFNISTAAALLTAAAGLPVAKHGNRKITSLSGSADVLSHLGVNIEAPVSIVERCLDEIGVGFCFAPMLHPAMKHVGPIRRSLGHPTVFNLLGPLSNPANAPFQLLGVGKPPLRPVLAAALHRLGIRRAAVVTGEDGLDEVTISGRTLVSLVTPDGVEETTWEPTDFGIATAPLDALAAEGPEASAEMIKRVISGEAGPPRDITVLNAAAAIWVAGLEETLAAAAARVNLAIDAGTAQNVLDQLAKLSHEAP